MMRSSIIFSFLAGVLCLCLQGCGYHVGFIRHPQLESVAVAPVVNDTAVYNAASDMRMMMSEVIMQDGTFKLSDQKKADAIIYLTVSKVEFSDVGDASIESDDRYSPDEWQTTVTVNYALILPGQGGKLREGEVKGSARFQAPLDIESSRLRAVRQSCYEAAQNIIYNLAEGW